MLESALGFHSEGPLLRPKGSGFRVSGLGNQAKPDVGNEQNPIDQE